MMWMPGSPNTDSHGQRTTLIDPYSLAQVGERRADRAAGDQPGAVGSAFLATGQGSYQRLLAPLAAGASVVLCANLDPERITSRVTAERVTRVL